jgi:hypothetical protein
MGFLSRLLVPHGGTSGGGRGTETCPGYPTLGGRCRRDHILKQHPRWSFTQAGGLFRWTAPSGRTYTVGPDIHPV